MKPLIIFYSYSGNNQKLAIELQSRIGCELREIKEKKKRKNIAILLDFLIKRDSRLAPMDVDLSNYGPVILLAPIWAGKIAAPMRSFIKNSKDDLSDYSFITICSGASGQREKIGAELLLLTSREPSALAELWINDLLPEEQRNKIKYTNKFPLKREHFSQFDQEIRFFIEMAMHPDQDTKTLT